MNGLLPIIQTAGSASGWLVAIVVLIGVWPKLSQIWAGSDGSLRQDLMEEIVRLRKENTEERKKCDDRMDELAKEHRKQLAELEKQIRDLQKEMRQLVASQARVMTSRITEQLDHVFPVPADVPTDLKEVIFKLDHAGDDAG